MHRLGISGLSGALLTTPKSMLERFVDDGVFVIFGMVDVSGQ